MNLLTEQYPWSSIPASAVVEFSDIFPCFMAAEQPSLNQAPFWFRLTELSMA